IFVYFTKPLYTHSKICFIFQKISKRYCQ
ncbi:hypothetical protein CFOL_v3_34779, partial [Cephalotus follicularis]